MIRGSILTLRERAREVGRRVVAAVMAEGVRRIVANAKLLAPVDSGLYRRSLTGTTVAAGEKTKAKINDGSGYGPQIVSKGVRPWEAHVSDPAREFVTNTGPREMGRQIIAGLRVRNG